MAARRAQNRQIGSAFPGRKRQLIDWPAVSHDCGATDMLQGTYAALHLVQQSLRFGQLLQSVGATRLGDYVSQNEVEAHVASNQERATQRSVGAG